MKPGTNMPVSVRAQDSALMAANAIVHSNMPRNSAYPWSNAAAELAAAFNDAREKQRELLANDPMADADAYVYVSNVCATG